MTKYLMPSVIKKETLNRYESLYTKVIASNLSIYELESLSLKEYNQALGTNIKKISSLKGQHRLLKQIRDNIEPVEQKYLTKRKITYSKSISRTKQKSDSLFDTKRKREKPKEKVKPKDKVHSKYKKVLMPKGKGQYGIVEIYDVDNDFSYWIKYKNQKDFDDKLGKLKSDSIEGKFNVIPQGLRDYSGFIDEQFQDILDGIGV